MPSPRPRPFWFDLSVRGVRFLYLLWGGMLVGNLALHNTLYFPDVLYRVPALVRFLTQPLGRGLLLGVAFTMALAALFEMWELVDRLLVRLMGEHERDR